MRDLFKQYASMRRFQKLLEESRQIVFYSEGPGGWPHLGPIAQQFLENGQTICWLSSDENDPGLHLNHPQCLPFYIGGGAVRILTFTALNCGVLVTTTPDLEQNQIKRSRYNPQYVYVHHSLVSHHMVYRPKAFAAFDAVLCAGNYHIQELEQEEAVYDIKPRKKLAHGYGRLDHLIERAKAHPHNTGAAAHVLVAPSWGEHGLVEGGYMGPLLESLFAQEYTVTLRPHPRTFQFAQDKIDALRKQFPALKLDNDIVSDQAILQCDVLISDWSGAALEYAFARLRPVLFMDTPRKVNNPDYQDMQVVPLEVEIRESIGVVLPPDDAQKAAVRITDLIEKQDMWAEKIAAVRQQTVFNIGGSAQAAYIEICKMLAGKEGKDAA